MTDQPIPSTPSTPRSNPTAPGFTPSILTRRRFLRAAGRSAGLAGLVGLGACSFPGTGPSSASGPTPTLGPGDLEPVDGPIGRLLPGAVPDRVLVVVDLQGGNDGLSTLIPAGDARYHDLRPDLALPGEEVLALDDQVGLHPSLVRLHARGITTVEGVGPVDGDLSHFAMIERWERGDVDGRNPRRTGFLGRLADALDDGSPLVAVSMSGPTPHLNNSLASTMALDGGDDLWFMEETDWPEGLAYQRGLARFDGAGDPLASMVTDGYRALERLAADMGDVGGYDDMDWELPMLSDGGDLGHSLYVAADLIAAGTGVRVVYAGVGDFDTHSGHPWRQADNLSRVDAAVGGFLDRADELGFADRVLVATVSEFGRRVPENDGGLDHGSASTMLLAGPVGDRRIGERPLLDELDEDDNLQVGIGFDRYLGALAEGWLGVEAASVLPDEPSPIDLF